MLSDEFGDKIDFLYVPFDWKTGSTFGYSFVNMKGHGTSARIVADVTENIHCNTPVTVGHECARTEASQLIHMMCAGVDMR